MAISLFISSCFIFSHSLFLSLSLSGGTVIHSCAKAFPRFILWAPPANLLAFFHQPGNTVLMVFWPASPRATTHPHRHNAKTPCQLDMTHATPHTHHCDNPVIINTNLSASAWRAEVLWSWRKGEGGGRKKGRHTKYRSWYCHLSGFGIRQQVWMWLHTRHSV